MDRAVIDAIGVGMTSAAVIGVVGGFVGSFACGLMWDMVHALKAWAEHRRHVRRRFVRRERERAVERAKAVLPNR